jgi:hypothetical protein
MGVRRMEAVSGTFTKWTKVSLFTSIFLVAYAYGLDGTSACLSLVRVKAHPDPSPVRYTYQVRFVSSKP